MLFIESYDDLTTQPGVKPLTTVDQDFAFHCAIAEATGNPRFKRFLEYLGRFIIPRRTIWKSETAPPPAARVQLDSFQKGHEAVLLAIQACNVAQARAAMQRHLLNSRRRYEKLEADNRTK